LIERVRVKNRHDCCGERLNGTKITVDGQDCGTITAGKGSNGKMFDVKCSKPIFGKTIRLTTTRRDYL
jgi:hypothetical protein